MRIKLMFAWYDIWTGLFIEDKRKIYLFPISIFGLVISY